MKDPSTILRREVQSWCGGYQFKPVPILLDSCHRNISGVNPAPAASWILRRLSTFNTDMKESGYGILPTILLVFQYPDWLIDTGANVHVCADASMVSSYQVTGTSPVLMGNGSHAIVRVLVRST